MTSTGAIARRRLGECRHASRRLKHCDRRHGERPLPSPLLHADDRLRCRGRVRDLQHVLRTRATSSRRRSPAAARRPAAGPTIEHRPWPRPSARPRCADGRRETTTSKKPTPSRYVDSSSWPSVHGSGCFGPHQLVGEPGEPGRHHHLAGHVVGPPLPGDEATGDERPADEQQRPQSSAPPGGSSGAPAITPAAPMPAAKGRGHHGETGRCERDGRKPRTPFIPQLHPRRVPRTGPGSPPVPQRPSSVIADGTRIERTIVASSSTATASPNPTCWRIDQLAGGEPAKTATMISAAPVMIRAGRRDAERDRFAVVVRLVVVLTDPAEQEDVVVHRQAEQDREEEEREPGLDRLDLRGSREDRRRRRPGRPARATRRPRRPRAGSSRSP